MSERITLRLTYAGQRCHNGKRVGCWVDADGKERLYPKLTGYSIGCVYEVEADDADGSIYGSTLRFTGEHVDDAEWRAADKVAATEIELASLERRYAKDDSFDEAMAPLRELYRKQRTYAQRSAFTALVLATMAERPPR